MSAVTLCSGSPALCQRGAVACGEVSLVLWLLWVLALTDPCHVRAGGGRVVSLSPCQFSLVLGGQQDHPGRRHERIPWDPRLAALRMWGNLPCPVRLGSCAVSVT